MEAYFGDAGEGVAHCHVWVRLPLGLTWLAPEMSWFLMGLWGMDMHKIFSIRPFGGWDFDIAMQSFQMPEQMIADSSNSSGNKY
jgi:hypothetical protein